MLNSPRTKEASVAKAGLQTGDTLGLHAGPVRVAASLEAFAAIRGDGASLGILNLGTVAGVRLVACIEFCCCLV